MIHITRSHNLSILSNALAEKLLETAPDDPLVSQKIVVPNLDTARWLKLHIAEQNEIAANLECLLPSEWLWKQVRKIYPALPLLLPSDLQPMKWSLYNLLIDPGHRKKFEKLDRYVQNQPEERREEAVFQLAGNIASVFDQYLVYRPGMMLRWQNGYSGKGDEKWQSELWRILNSEWKKSRDNGEINKTRAELFFDVMNAFSEGKVEADGCLYIFNPGLLSQPMISMLKETGKQSELFIYRLSPSKELQKNENEIVQLFGSEAETTDQMFNRLNPEQKIELFFSVSFESPLKKIQADILNGTRTENLPEVEKRLPGIEIRSCHSPLREIEVLHQFLLEQFEEDENLHPDDILIATPDLDTYRPYIKAVFDQSEKGLPQIPYHLGYSDKDTGAEVERALRHLLSLVESRFEFADVMDLFVMKPVHAAFGISETECSGIRRWMEENHVFWGLNAEHRSEFDQPADDLQTWDMAFRRGWYGHLLGGNEGDTIDDLLLYQSIRTTNDQESWGAFSNYVHQLNRMRSERKRKHSGSEWCKWLLSHMHSLFDESSLAGKEARKILQVLGRVNDYSTVAQCDAEIPFSLFRKELTSLLERHTASGVHFTNGVTFSSMVPVRSIPFKVIALIGLNENAFPRKKITPDFDLMAQEPLPGERNRKNEDRNLFLESVMAAGQVHFCSYIGQNQVDNEEIPPSTIVSEWAEILAKASGVEAGNIIKKEALSGFSPLNFQSKKNYSSAYFQTARNLLDDEDAVSGFNINHPLPADEFSDSVQIEDLTRFYSNPIRWFLRKRMNVSLRETDSGKEEFVLDNLEEHLLFQRVFGWVLNGTEDRQIQSYLVQSGAVPAGWAGERKVLELRENVHHAISAMKEAKISPQQEYREIFIETGEKTVEGSLLSYSGQQLVDVNPSKLSGKVVMNCWIKHLCGMLSDSFEEKTSILFCDLKKGEPKMRIFKPVEKAGEFLSDLISLYEEGVAEPKTFFPKTLFEFENAERNRKKSDPFKKAASEFEGGYMSFGEREDLSILTVLGDDITFQSGFITDRYRRIMSQIFDHMEEG